MQGSVVVSENGKVIHQVSLDDRTIEVGRIASNDLVLPNVMVSRRHARISPTSDGWEVIDLGSANKLLHEGRRIDRIVVRHGDRITIGPFLLTFNVEELPAPAESTDRLTETSPIVTIEPDDPAAAHLVTEMTCHHCWHQFQPEQLVWIARHEELRGDAVATGPMGVETFIRFRPSRFNVKGEAVDARGLPCNELACPNCHLQIPSLFLESEPLFISIVGAPASGKSNILAAMTWELRRILLEKFKLAFNDADTISNHIVRTYENTLFQHPRPDELVYLSKTQLEMGDLYDGVNLNDQPVLLPRPFLFLLRRVEDSAKLSGGEQGRTVRQSQSRVLCLYDNAGEHFLPGGESTLTPGTQHMARCRVLMFVFDPTQIPKFRKECLTHNNDPQLRSDYGLFRQDAIMTEAAARVRQYARLSPQEKLSQPLLVLVSKSDVYSHLLPDEDIVNDPYRPARNQQDSLVVDYEKIEHVSSGLRALLLKFAPEFVTAAEDACKTVFYLPISALGRSPEPMPDSTAMFGIRPGQIQPHWATVPILFAFGKWSRGLISQDEDSET